MKDFNRFYLWGVNTKYSMGLYFSAAVFVKGLVNVLMETWTIDVIILLEILLACFAFACLESALFPYGKNLLAEKKRVAAWAVLANVIFIGCGWGLGWFPGLPLWGGLLLVLFLECGLGAMWYALYLNEKRDTAALNQGLHRFQSQN